MSWIPNKKESKGLTFVVEEAQAGDVGKGIARIYQDKIEELGLKPADIVELVSGASKTVARVHFIWINLLICRPMPSVLTA